MKRTEGAPERLELRKSRARHIGRLLPGIGIVLFLLPLLWTSPTPTRSSSVMIYLFVIWLLLIVLAALVHLFTRKAPETGEHE